MLRSAVAQQDALPGVDQNVVESPAFAQVLEEYANAATSSTASPTCHGT